MCNQEILYTFFKQYMLDTVLLKQTDTKEVLRKIFNA